MSWSAKTTGLTPLVDFAVTLTYKRYWGVQKARKAKYYYDGIQ
jgi:hypothetical protein